MHDRVLDSKMWNCVKQPQQQLRHLHTHTTKPISYKLQSLDYLFKSRPSELDLYAVSQGQLEEMKSWYSTWPVTTWPCSLWLTHRAAVLQRVLSVWALVPPALQGCNHDCPVWQKMNQSWKSIDQSKVLLETGASAGVLRIGTNQGAYREFLHPQY